MGQVIRAKQRSNSAIVYSALQSYSLGTVTVVPSTTSSTVQFRVPLPYATKIVAVSVVPSGTVVGPISFNIVSGAVPYTQGSVPQTDTSLYSGFPSVVAQPGQALFAADQVIVPTAELVQNYYPALFDAIWASGTQVTLRLTTGAAASGTVTVRLGIVPVDNNPGTPQSSNSPFIPGITTL